QNARGNPARAELQEYTRRAADRARARILLCRTLRLLGDVPGAIREGRLAVREQPASPLAWQALGLALVEGSPPERAEAEAALRKAIERAPHFPAAHAALGDLTLLRQDYARAAAEFAEALAEDPGAGI